MKSLLTTFEWTFKLTIDLFQCTFSVCNFQNNINKSNAIRPDSTDWSDVPSPRMHKLRFTDAGNIQYTPLVAGEDVHLVTMAEKLRPALLVTAHPAKKARKGKPEAEKAATKKARDKERSGTESTSVLRLSGRDNWGM